MVDYDAAVQAVSDQNADPVLLARIAYENPEFGANVAANPRCYPGLKHWLATFGDERAKEYLAQQGFVDDLGDVAQRTTGQDAAQPQPEAQPAQQAAYEQVAYEQPAYEAPQSQQPAVQAQPVQPEAQPVQQPAAQSFVPPEQIQATNPYGFTAQQALDPNTDQNTLAQIDTYAPELWPCLAKNPNTYQALRDWLAGLNDPAVNATLASRG